MIWLAFFILCLALIAAYNITRQRRQGRLTERGAAAVTQFADNVQADRDAKRARHARHRR